MKYVSLAIAVFLMAMGASGDWVTYRGDPGLAGATDTKLPGKPAQLWRTKAGSALSGTPLIKADRIYVTTWSGDIVALDMAGKILWKKTFKLVEGAPETGGSEGLATPPVIAGDVIVAGTSHGRLLAANLEDGSEAWSYETGAKIQATPNLVDLPDGKGRGVIVVSQEDGVIHCVDAKTGKKVWVSEMTNRCDGSPSAGNGKIVYGNCDSALYVFSAKDGSIHATVDLGPEAQVAGGVAIRGGRVYSGNRNGELVCADMDTGKAVWRDSQGMAETFECPAVSESHVVYAANDGIVYALGTKDGKPAWDYESDGMAKSPVIAGDKVVMAVDGTVVILSLKDGQELWSNEVGGDVYSPAVQQGRIFVGGDDGYVTVFGEK